jgi:hypothetical protein
MIAFPVAATVTAMIAVAAWGELSLIPSLSVQGFIASCLVFGAAYLALMYLAGGALNYRLVPLTREMLTILRTRQITRKDDHWKP